MSNHEVTDWCGYCVYPFMTQDRRTYHEFKTSLCSNRVARVEILCHTCELMRTLRSTPSFIHMYHEADELARAILCWSLWLKALLASKEGLG